MKEKRLSGSNLGGQRRHADPPAWLDESLPLEQRRKLLDLAIRANASPAIAAPAVPAHGLTDLVKVPAIDGVAGLSYRRPK